MKTNAERIEASVRKTSSECWEWNKSRLPNGYGRVGPTKGLLAHRWAWKVYRGEIPAGLCVLHRCDNRSCVNPDHLFLGTKKDNTQDAIRKGRLVLRPPSSYPNWKPGRCIGTSNPASKLTMEAASEARKLYSEGMFQREIAEKLGVTQALISRVVRNESWVAK